MSTSDHTMRYCQLINSWARPTGLRRWTRVAVPLIGATVAPAAQRESSRDFLSNLAHGDFSGLTTTLTSARRAAVQVALHLRGW